MTTTQPLDPQWPIMPPLPPAYETVIRWIDLHEAYLTLSQPNVAGSTLSTPGIVFELSGDDAPVAGSILAWGSDIMLSSNGSHLRCDMLHGVWTRDWNHPPEPHNRNIDLGRHGRGRRVLLCCAQTARLMHPCAWFQALLDHPDPVALAVFHIGSPPL